MVFETRVTVIHFQTLLYLASFYMKGTQAVTVMANLEHFNKVTLLDEHMRDSPISLAGEFDIIQCCYPTWQKHEMLLTTHITSKELKYKFCIAIDYEKRAVHTTMEPGA